MSKLEADDWVVDEPFAESLALVCVFHGFLVADAREAQALDDDTDTLVVEVGHDHLEALVLLADEVLDWYLDVFKGDVCGAARPHTLAVHFAGGNTTSFSLNEKHRDTVHALATGTDSGREVVAPNTVGDPLLLAVHNIMLTVFGEFSLAGQVGDVATSICKD